MANRLEGDWTFTGRISPKAITYPNGGMSNAGIAADANVDASKLQQQYTPRYAQPNTTATTETREFHFVHGTAGTIYEFVAGIIGACVGGATITVDLKKNGASILSSVVTIDNSVAAYGTVSGVFTADTLAAGDVLTIVITATAGGGTIGTGFFCSAKIRETAD